MGGNDVMSTPIRSCRPSDLDAMFQIINDAAQAYRGIIPAEAWVPAGHTGRKRPPVADLLVYSRPPD
jgi:hypothetical protein